MKSVPCQAITAKQRKRKMGFYSLSKITLVAFLFFLLGFCLPLAAQQTGPRLFFTDLESGPNTGGEQNLGTFITIYGEGFGSSRGSSIVTIGGREVARYVIWGQDNAPRSLDMIVVQPGPNVVSGNIVVTVNGRASNGMPFTVRPGKIFFAIPGSSSASDANPGTFEQPFKTIYRPRQVMEAGDTVYIKGGAFTAADPAYPSWDAVLLLFPDLNADGTEDNPIAYIGYPGDPPVLGGPRPMRRGIYMEEVNHYLIANLRFTQHSGMLELSGNGHRAIGNYSYDGIYSNSGAIGIAGDSAHLKVYGNRLRNNGEPGNKLNGSAFYIQGFGTNKDIDFGWNQIQDQRGARAIQLFGHRNGDRMDNIRIHDNWISGSELNNIVLGGSDGNTEVLGTIYVYNNIIVGSGDPGLRVNDPQGTVFIQNNVLYNNGSPGFNGEAQIYIQRAGTARITFQNNIVYAGTGQSYFLFEPGADSSSFKAASNNLLYNAGACPSWIVGCINADPQFVAIASDDFRLKAQSPAIDAGIDTGIGQDYMGVLRPQGGGYDIGAHEYTIETVARIPGKATLVSPSATISSATPAYIWNAVPDATWYLLWVNNNDVSPLILTWYTATQAGCPAGTGTCSVTPSTALAAGAGAWWIQTWNPVGYGPWSDALTFSVSSSGLPAAAILVSPSGAIASATPRFIWMAVSNASWYYLWVNDGGSSGAIKQWFTAAQAGCVSGTGSCSVTPAQTLAAGDCVWWIQTWNSAGYGPWSFALRFTVSSGNSPIAAARIPVVKTMASAMPRIGARWQCQSFREILFLQIQHAAVLRNVDEFDRQAPTNNRLPGTGSMFEEFPYDAAASEAEGLD